jgi:hypothetical protein
MMGLLNTQWKGKHVVINENQEDYTVGVIKHIDWVLDENTYKLPMRVAITFEEGSDVDYKIFEVNSLDIKLDKRYYE